MTVRNIHSWPTLSLRLLQPTLGASHILQTADKSHPETPAAKEHFSKNMLSSPQLFGGHWGTTDLKIFFANENRRKSSVSKVCKSSEASLTGIDLIYKNSFKRLDWLQTLCVTLFLSIVGDLNRVTILISNEMRLQYPTIGIFCVSTAHLYRNTACSQRA